MTRRFLDEVKNDLSALLVTAGDVKAPDLLATQIDLIDSLNTDQAAIYGDNSQSLTTTDSFISIAGYNNLSGGDPDFLKLDTVAGTITTATIAGFSYSFLANISYRCENNADYEFSLMENGVATGFVGTITGSGNNDLQSIAIGGTKLSASTNSVWSISFRSLDGGDDVELLQYSLRADIIPTNNP